MSEVLSQVASFGRMDSSIHLIIAYIVGAILLLAGFYFKTHTDPDSIVADATVTSSICSSRRDARGNTLTDCTTDVTFPVNGTIVSGQLSDSVSKITGSTVQVRYNPSKPSQVEYASSMSYSSIGNILIVSSFAIVAINYAINYFVQSSPAFATVSGAGDIAGLIRSI